MLAWYGGSQRKDHGDMYQANSTSAPSSAQSVFRFDLEREPNRLVVRLWGELDIANARRLREAFGALGDGEERELLVDLAEVPFIDSTCLAVLVWAGNRCREQGRQLVLRAPTRAVVSALAASGLLRSFRYDASSLDSAKPWPTRLPAPAGPRLRPVPATRYGPTLSPAQTAQRRQARKPRSGSAEPASQCNNNRTP